MRSSEPRTPRHYFTTRDLLVMAVLAGLGGVASTAINALGDVVQAALGFSGTTQWAAGLHVTLLILAAGLTGKDGSATVTGLLKGGVELLSGNTHGIMVILVDLAAGLLVDLCLLPFRSKDSRWAYLLAGGFAAASNVFVFQLFASAPEDVLKFVWGIAGLASVSGVVFGGLLAHSLLLLLRRGGLAPARPPARMARARYALFLSLATVCVLAGGVFLALKLKGPSSVRVTGEVGKPYAFTAGMAGFTVSELALDLQGMRRNVVGVPVREIVARAQPHSGTASLLVSAQDGYAFFITLDEVAENDQLLLAESGRRPKVSYDIVGARNQKAWVRNVVELRLVAQALIEVSGSVERPFPYNPADWQTVMDNGRFDFGDGELKYQGTLLRDVMRKWEPSGNATLVVLSERSGRQTPLQLAEVLTDGETRIWNVNRGDGMHFAVAKPGTIYARDVIAILVQ